MSKFSTLRQRSITGLLFGIVVIALLWSGKVGVGLLITAINFGVAWELGKIRGVQAKRLWLFSGMLLLPTLLGIVDLWLWTEQTVLAIFAAAGLIMVYATILFRHGSNIAVRELIAYTLGAILVTMPCLAAVGIVQIATFGSKMLLVVLGMLWANDTFAYFVGSQFGKTPLAPMISPGKTLEGTLGGVVITLILTVLVVLGFAFADWTWIGIALLVCAFGSIGDLVQSAFKRVAGVKDSGNLLPGHGGLWDRFDSFLGSLPFVFIYLILS